MFGPPMRTPASFDFAADLQLLVLREMTAAAGDGGRLAAMVGPLANAMSLALAASSQASSKAVVEAVARMATPKAEPLTTPPGDRLAYSVKQFAATISLSQATVWRLIKEDKIRVVKIGGRTLIPADQIGRTLRRHD